MTALKAKTLSLEKDDTLVFSTFLAHNYPKFIQSYLEWDEDHNLFSDGLLDIARLNAEFLELYDTPEAGSLYHIADTTQDYNFIVDYIF